MSKSLYALATGASLIAFYSSAFAADTKMAPVVVSATRSPVPMDQIASSMTVITHEDIEKSNKQTVTDVLRTVPGVMLAQSGGVGQPASVFMRGTESRHVLVMIDGVAVNSPIDPSTIFDFSNVTVDNVERIEIMRGPQSTLYGASAIGGVINIITKQGKGAPSYNGFVEYGRYNSRKAGVGTSGSVGRTSYSAAISESHTDGYSAFDKRLGGTEQDGNDTYTFSANVISALTDNFTAKFNTRYNRTDSEFDLFGGDSTDPHSDNRQINGRAAGELKLLDGKWTQELGFGVLDNNRSINTGYGFAHYYGGRNTADWIHHLKLAPDNTLTLGVEGWEEDYRTSTQSRLSVSNKAIFAQDQFNIGKNFFATAGVRLDKHETFGREMTWKVAPGYRIDATGTTLKATYGTGFKAPSLFNLYDPFYGNPNLQAEKSAGWDAGFEQILWDDKLSFGATWFHNDIRQLIDFDFATFKYANVGRARTKGVESFVTVHPLSNLTLGATYTYTLADDAVNDRQLLRRPHHQATANATYDYSAQGDVSAAVRYVGQRRDVDLAFNTATIGSFATLDLSTNYKLNPIVTLYGRLDNALDRRYQEVLGYGTSGRALFGGVRAGF